MIPRLDQTFLSRLPAWQVFWIVPLLALTLSACGGYTLVRKSELQGRPVRVVVDSSTVVALRQQLTTLQAQCRTDSIRHANTPGKASTNQDSIIRQRDAEITSLKEQLNKAQDELERIKRRLANPTK